MLISDVQNKDEITALIITELKDLGVKYRKKKTKETTQEKCNRKRIFGMHLHLLELTDVILANGGIVQIPHIVADSCQRILEHVAIEGIFRKAGSSLRQKEIKNSLEAGLSLGKTHHVIDVANVVKLFFRELPEPLLSQHIQESLLRALLIGEERIKAIMMTCLLLPPLTINTLAFFLQFLKTVADSSAENKMSVENLAIIFTPGLMPFWDISSIRFKNHVKVIQILIENADRIGVLPDSVVDRIFEGQEPPPGRAKSVEILGPAIVSKKKKRRSGMFNGLRKIVGSIGSSDNLDNTTENNLSVPSSQMTPCLSKSTKKRKIDPMTTFSAKKKKDLMAMMSENGGVLPNTPLCVKETKKSRLSLGGRKNLKYASNLNIVSSMERRWSIVGTGWSKGKKNSKDKPSTSDLPTPLQPPLSPVLSLPCVAKIDFSDLDEVDSNVSNPSDVSYVRIPKTEYEDIKERVFAIENRLSQEFGKVRDSLLIENSPEIVKDIPDHSFSGAERVFTEFQRTIEQTEIFESSPTTDRLAKRLSRELKIRRRSVENERVCRSPSARKIGTIRRRSREMVRLSRNNTWHITNSNEKVVPKVKEEDSGNFFYPKANLKRGRPNTFQSGLPKTPKREDGGDLENWTSGEQFFENIHDENCLPNIIEPMTPIRKKKSMSPSSTMKTPMLPPKSIPRRAAGSQFKGTPSSAGRSMNRQQHLTATSLFQTPIDPECNGRASIARLRTQNAGQVMAKAKLFDGMGETPVSTGNSKSAKNNRRMSRKFDLPSNNCKSSESRRQSRKFSVKIDEESSFEQRTPRRKLLSKSPGCVQKRTKPNFTATKYPQREILEQMVTESSNIVTNLSSPRTQVPNIKKGLKTYNNSPRRIKTPHRLETQNMSRRKTPMKVTTPVGLRNSPRNSPRFTNRNARHF
ncbi:ARHGAP11A family protein [Megaselia abdita]